MWNNKIIGFSKNKDLKSRHIKLSNVDIDNCCNKKLH